MSTEPDNDLFGIIYAETDKPEWAVSEVHDAILAAGYRRPRTITTTEELDALKLPAIINAQNGGPARVDYCYGPSRRKYVEYIFGEDDRDYSLESFAEFMGAATVLCEEA